MRAFLATTLLGREWGDDGMNPKAIKKFSIGVESYVPIITCKGFFTQSQVLLSSIVAVGNVKEVLGNICVYLRNVIAAETE